MMNTFGFPPVPNTLATGSAVSKSFSTTATKAIVETTRSTAYTTVIATAIGRIPPTLLGNATAAYTAVHKRHIATGTVRDTLAEQLPVLYWVLAGAVCGGAGVVLIRRYRKKTPPTPVPPGQDEKKWKRIANRVTIWLQEALRTNAKIRQEFHEAQQAVKGAQRQLDQVGRELREVRQQVEDIEKAEEKKEEENSELRQELKEAQADSGALRKRLIKANQNAEEQEKLILAGKELEDDQQTELEEHVKELQKALDKETFRREKLELDLKLIRSPKVDTGAAEEISIPRTASLVSGSPNINASPFLVPSSTEQSSSTNRKRVSFRVDNFTPIPFSQGSIKQPLRQLEQPSRTAVSTASNWIPTGNITPITSGSNSAKHQAIPRQDSGGVYAKIERILQRDARIENTPTNQRKRGREDGDGDEEACRPAKLRRSSLLGGRGQEIDAPKVTPLIGLSFGDQGKEKTALNPLLWGSDGKAAVKFGHPEDPESSSEPEIIKGVNMTDVIMTDDSSSTDEVPVIARPGRIPSPRRSRLPVASNISPPRRSTRPAIMYAQNLNEAVVNNYPMSRRKGDQQDSLETTVQKQPRMPARIGQTSSEFSGQQTRSVSPSKDKKETALKSSNKTSQRHVFESASSLKEP